MKPVAKERGKSGDRNKPITVVAAVVVVAALLVGGMLWINSSKNATQGVAVAPNPASKLGPGVVEKRDGAVVSVGKPGAPKTIDLYADFLCPMCAMVQAQLGPALEKAVNNGKLTVRYHMMTMLDQASDPPGYSTDSANAALAAADSQKFTAFHDALLKNQPAEGGRGYDKSQLIQLGQNLGITEPEFAQTVNAGTYNQQLHTAFPQALSDPGLLRDNGRGQKVFGTPTFAVNGKAIDISGDWLTAVLNE